MARLPGIDPGREVGDVLQRLGGERLGGERPGGERPGGRRESAYAATQIEQEWRHWWYRGRLRILVDVLRAALPGGRPLRLLDVGCGAGHVLEALGEFGEAVGVECQSSLVTSARARGLDVRSGGLPDALPVPRAWADVAVVLDVIEHLEDDRQALRAMSRAVRSDGWLVVTVPAYQWLWSGHDVALGHHRRYTASRLRRTIEDAGLRLERISYFNTLLFPAFVLRRAWTRLRGDDGHDLVHPGDPANRWLERTFALERHVVARAALPFGASLLAIART